MRNTILKNKSILGTMPMVFKIINIWDTCKFPKKLPIFIFKKISAKI